MRTRDDLKALIETLRDRHSLLAAYLEAADKVDWRALNRPVAIGELAPVANDGLSDRHRSELAGSCSHVAASHDFPRFRAR
jgi:hypothetical protein